MRIAITFRDDQHLNQTWFGSGIAQNIKFYYDLFESMGHDVFMLVNSSLGMQHNGKSYQELRRDDAYYGDVKLDFVIEAGVTVNREEQALLRSNCGAKIIGLRCGNQYNFATEGMFVNQQLDVSQFIGGQDALWILPHHKQQAQWLSVLHGCEVSVVPYIWEPDFVERTFETVSMPAVSDIVVMEPNISILKNAMIPLAAIQSLYSSSPSSFGRATIYNSERFANAENFLYNFVDNLPVLQAHHDKVYFEPRKPFTEIFDQPHVLLGHQVDNELNYLYNEAIYMGIPLVCNAPPYAEVSYFYNDLNAKEAATAIQLAIDKHEPAKVIEKGQKFLNQYSISNSDVQKCYEHLLS